MQYLTGSAGIYIGDPIKMKLNEYGLYFYNNSQQQTVGIDATTGNASFNGTIYAQSGSIGGWTIGANSLTAGTGASAVGLSTSGYPIFAGSSTASSAPFSVTSAGLVTATNIKVNVGGDIALYNDGTTNNSIIKFFGASAVGGTQREEARLTYFDSGNAAGSNNALVFSKTANITNFYMKCITTGTGTFEIGASATNTSGEVIIKDSIMIATNMIGGDLATDEVQGHYISPTLATFRRNSSDTTAPVLALHRFNSAGALTTTRAINFILDGTEEGFVTISSTLAPAFGGASDYRLKTNIEDFNYASELIKKIRLRSFKWKEQDSYAVGFIAHELAESILDVVIGEKDQVDELGNPEYQAIVESRLLPYAIGALKEALLDIETLKSDIAELRTLISGSSVV